MSKHPIRLWSLQNRNAVIATFAILRALPFASVDSAMAAPVDPATLNPYVHLDANLGVTSGGVDTTVTAWQDQSSNGFLFQSNHPNAGSNDPTLRSGPNFNLATIEFDGSDIIDSDSSLQLFTANDSALTVFTVMSSFSLPGNQQFLINHAPGVGGDSFELGPDAGQVQSPGAWGIHRGSGQATSTGPNALTTGDFVIMTTEVNILGLAGSNVAFFKNGDHQPNISTGWLSPGNYETGSDPLAIGARVDNKGQGFDDLTPDSFFDGQLSELIVFRNQLSTSDRQGVEEFLGNKYDISVTQSVAPPPLEPPTPLRGDVIGDELILRTNTDSDSGAVYIYGTGTFSGPGVASEFGFVGPVAGRDVTPLIIEVASGSIDDDDAVFTITGIGESITSSGGTDFQKAPFTLLAGSDQVTSNHTFGHFDGEVVADGAGGIEVVSRNQGTVSFGSAGDGAWAFSGGGQVPFDLELGENFATFVDTGGSGDFFDPIKVFSRADGNGRSYSAQMSAISIAGDYNGNGVLDTDDINMLVWESASGQDNSDFDLTHDGLVNQEDVMRWIQDPSIGNSWVGDANFDGKFDSGDLVAVFTAGKYELAVEANWTEGDWTGDHRFNSSDLVAAFTDGGYELGPRVAPAAVPEPSALVLMLAALILALRKRG